jgi:hypothetical protein
LLAVNTAVDVPHIHGICPAVLLIPHVQTRVRFLQPALPPTVFAPLRRNLPDAPLLLLFVPGLQPQQLLLLLLLLHACSSSCLG